MGTTTAMHHHATREAAPAGEVDGDAVVCRSLGRHAQRRRQGIPTLSVLFAEHAGEAAWHRWVTGVGSGLRAGSVPWPRAAEDLRALEGGVAPLWVPPPDGHGNGDGLAVAVDLLAGWLERAVPSGAWVCGLLVPTAGAAAYLADAPESRAKAYFREGLIVLPARASELATVVGHDPEPGTACAAANQALGMMAGAEEGVRTEALARVDAAASALDAALAVAPAQPADGPEDDGARSAAERFLFAMLEALPGTAGWFALNAPLPGNVRFGPAPAEVDLLAVGPRVAVEVDGYHHFTGAERYRRDRRKDVLLQEQGFLVLRFLADDVVPRLEPILDTIRTAVARRLPQP